MNNKKETKERVENEIRDAYMAFTIGVQATDFDKYLKLVVEYILSGGVDKQTCL